MRILTSKEMRAVDSASAEKHGVHLLTLMENAGAAVARHARREYAHAERIAVFCGKGNNGGDGIVAARHLDAADREVDLYLLADVAELSADAARMLKRSPVKPRMLR